MVPNHRCMSILDHLLLVLLLYSQQQMISGMVWGYYLLPFFCYSQQQMISGMVLGCYMLLFLLLLPAIDDIRPGLGFSPYKVICSCFCCYSQQQMISGIVWGYYQFLLYYLFLFLLLFPATLSYYLTRARLEPSVRSWKGGPAVCCVCCLPELSGLGQSI